MARRLVRGFIGAGVGVLATLAFLALATPAAAQQGVTTGAINGRVMDTSGAPLAGALRAAAPRSGDRSANEDRAG